MIKEGKSKEERFEILSEIAKYQLNNAEKIKLLIDAKKVGFCTFLIKKVKIIQNR